MDEHSLQLDPHFTGFTPTAQDNLEQPQLLNNLDDQFLNDGADLNALIEQSLTPLSVGNIITSMNQNIYQHEAQQQQQIAQPMVTSLNQLSMYHLLSGNMNIGGMPVIILNLPQQAVASPATPSAEMTQLTMQEPIAGSAIHKNRIIQEEEPPYKKRRPSVVDESDMDLMALSHQMDLLRRNSLPVLHTIHVPRHPAIQPSISVDDLISPSKFFRNDDIDLLGEYGSHNGGEVVSVDDEEDAEPQPDSPPHNHNPFDFGNFYATQTAPPAKNEKFAAASLQPLQIPTSQGANIHVQSAPTPTEQPKKQRRRKSTPGGETPGSTPGTPDGRKLVCLGKRPRKNKKTQPEDQYLMKFTMRRNK